MRGKVSQYKNMKQMCKDHPRLCGEKVQQHKAAVRIQGSPPPMRGKVASAVIACMCVGITPAYAGKSEPVQKHETDVQGSPPPMRGKAWRALK